MDHRERVAAQFEEHRPRLRAVAYRMLGSASEADDAVQETWLRLGRANAREIDNLGAWLTTVVGRVSLNMLRARKTRREESLEGSVPDVAAGPGTGGDPEGEAILVDSVGLALLVVLETLAPAERLAFILHDMFGVPFDEIATIVDRSPEASRQLASRARRRVRGASPGPDAGTTARREVVDAFLAAAREGDFAALVAVLDPDVVLHADFGIAAGGRREVRGAQAVARQALTYAQLDLAMHQVPFDGAVRFVGLRDGQPYSVGDFTVQDGKIVAIEILADPERLRQLDLTFFDEDDQGMPGMA
jgi:RNA polymerase sigma-70 factor (ECF subfamily)